MKRTLYQRLLAWKAHPDRKPLLLQGARQVGKTYLLKEFGQSEYSNVAYLNFEQSPEFASLFESSLEPKSLIATLGAALGKRIEAAKTLLILDEIQSSQRALTSLKYFCEEAPEYHVAAAGSLLGVSVGTSSSFPVGKVNFLSLYPMSFFEYLEAAGEELVLEQLIRKVDCNPLPHVLHDKLITLYKFFLFLGGMPEVVSHYLEHQDIQAARSIQREILRAYERDFSKYTTASGAIRTSEIWRAAPALLAKENKKFRYVDVRKGGRASQFESAIEWLRKSGLVHPVINIKTSKLPLSGYSDNSKFKLYIMDSGLLGAMLNVSSSTIVTGDKLFSEYCGAFVENYVVTELVKWGFEDLYYWTSGGEAEVDLILAHRDNIYPLEIKSGMSRRTKSIRVYAAKHKPSHVFRTSPRNYTRDGDLTNIPLYAIARFSDVVDRTPLRAKTPSPH